MTKQQVEQDREKLIARMEKDLERLDAMGAEIRNLIADWSESKVDLGSVQNSIHKLRSQLNLFKNEFETSITCNLMQKDREAACS